MAVLTVGQGEQFSTIAAAVGAAGSGDTIDVNAGSYTDDFLTIEQNLTLQAVGGEVVMTEDQEPPDGKAMITEGQPGLSIAINGFDISGVTVDDGNGAAIRYEGGNLSLSNDFFHNNQDGLLAASDPNGTITIDNSEFSFNGNGEGNTHNIYVNDIALVTITNSYFHDADVGHEIKSRAQDTVIENNRIFDNNSSASYDIDLPDGGNATITGNQIEQGPNTQNPYMITYGVEEDLGAVTNPGTDVTIANNTIVNDDPGGAMLLNFTDVAPAFTDNSVYGLTDAQLSPKGPLDEAGTVFLASRPSLDTSSLSFITSSPPPSTPTPLPTVPVGSGADTLDLQVNEDAWNGDAQFTVAVDGQQIGGTLTALASHAAGATQDFLVMETLDRANTPRQSRFSTMPMAGRRPPIAISMLPAQATMVSPQAAASRCIVMGRSPWWSAQIRSAQTPPPCRLAPELTRSISR